MKAKCSSGGFGLSTLEVASSSDCGAEAGVYAKLGEMEQAEIDCNEVTFMAPVFRRLKRIPGRYCPK